MPRSTIAVLMTAHSDSVAPGVTPPLTIDQRNKPLAPKPESFIRTLRHILAGAEHEQQIGGLDRRRDKMPGADLGDLRLRRLSRASILPLRLAYPPHQVTTKPPAGPDANSTFLAPF